MFLANKLLLILAILGLVIVANLVFLNYKAFTQKDTEKVPQPTPTAFTTPVDIQSRQATTSGEPNLDIQNLIDSKISQLREELLGIIKGQPVKTQTKTIVQQQTQHQAKEIFINFGNSGSTKETDWVDISGTDISFNKDNYPGAKTFYFQANLKSDAADRDTFARIYDATNFVGVQGSDMEFRGMTSTLTQSGEMTFFSGDLTLRVQIHSLNGNLATVENPRIKIVY